ncbi:MAG: hypothetical protein LBB58_02965, partial [Cellulomonadaceae bacterium]|nr:hypothetical protein [Cellulomonadaceae bacterium]
TEIVVRAGRYGPYVTEVLPEPAEAAGATKKKAAAPKARTASLFRDMTIESVTLDDALKLMSLPRVVGADPESGAEITAQNGRYGPYIKKGTDSRTIAEESLLFTITLPEALAIFAEPKQRRGARTTAPLRELGMDPESEKPIVIKEGRFGPYLTDGVTNRTVPRELSVELITPEQAVALLAEKRAAGPAPKRAGAKRATTAKAAAGKSGAAAKTSGATKPSPSKLKTMTIADLKAYGQTELALEFTGKEKKADLIAAITSAPNY